MFLAFHTSVPTGWPFNPLESLLQSAAADSHQRAAFWKALIESNLFVLGKSNVSNPSTGIRRTEPGEELSLQCVQLDSGSAIAAFTSLEILRLSINAELQFMELAARALFEMTSGSRIALNPCGPFGQEFTPEEIRLAMGGAIMLGDNQVELTRHSKILLGRLAREPQALLDALMPACKADPEVNAAYISGVFMVESGERSAHPLIGFDSLNFAATRRTIGPEIESWVKTSEVVVDVVDMRTPGTMAEHLRSAGRCFYVKQGFASGWLGKH